MLPIFLEYVSINLDRSFNLWRNGTTGKMCLKKTQNFVCHLFTILKQDETTDLQDEVRISKKDYESQRAKMYSPQDQWYHIDCFVKERDDLGFGPSVPMDK